MERILIVGSGYVGLTAAVCFASFGNRVVLFDKNREKIDQLSSGRVPFYEQGLSDFYARVRENIFLTCELKDHVSECRFVFIAVGTSLRNETTDLTDYMEAVVGVSKLLNRGKILVIKSTVPVDALQWTRKELGRNSKEEFSLVVNPEFLREGNALYDFNHPDRIVIGVEDDFAKDKMLELYRPIDAPKVITSPETACMIKYVSNAFLATKISFINEIADICGLYGIDVKEVEYAVGLDRRIGRDYLSAGIGFGGSCLLKDVVSLIEMSEDKGYHPDLIKATREVNFKRVTLFVEKIRHSLGDGDRKLGVWGISFKPNTGDIRGSRSIEIMKRLLALGYSLKAYDPKANDNARRLFGDSVRVVDDPLSAVVDASALLVLTDWPQFKDIDLIKVKSLMKKPYLFDGRNLFDPREVMEKGFKYFGVGRGIDHQQG